MSMQWYLDTNPYVYFSYPSRTSEGIQSFRTHTMTTYTPTTSTKPPHLLAIANDSITDPPKLHDIHAHPAQNVVCFFVCWKRRSTVLLQHWGYLPWQSNLGNEMESMLQHSVEDLTTYVNGMIRNACMISLDGGLYKSISHDWNEQLSSCYLDMSIFLPLDRSLHPLLRNRRNSSTIFVSSWFPRFPTSHMLL